MKGIIANCLKETIVTKFEQAKWEEIMIVSGLKKNMTILATVDIDDAVVMKIVENSCKILKIPLEELADYFGDYWMNSFAPRIYKPYYETSTNAKEFILKLTNIHDKVTKNIKNAKPPQFEYDWKTENTLILTYISQRGLIDFVVGLAKGVGNYFNQKLSVRKLSSTKVEIIF